MVGGVSPAYPPLRGHHVQNHDGPDGRDPDACRPPGGSGVDHGRCRQQDRARPGLALGGVSDLQPSRARRLVGGAALRRRPVACGVPGRRQGAVCRPGRLRQDGREGQAGRRPRRRRP